ncbi:hypothetical protein B0T24DRAFT_645599 [Lasiosphaeria ovina]|uniref:Uncharacterized protein n=1 Tax=Lasiosphaeria ovina TaxID=92902 RepID=A0AAE0TXK1_9PEZI|nr:hypothetical protein B0T24DRAFT_645599 [Lasiosphaeria ovina]
MAPLPRHRILHHLRLEWESHHRQLPDIKDLEHLAADMTMEQADFCCNKSVAVYIMTAEKTLFPRAYLLLEMLHNHLYDKWFRPYRRKLEYGQFLARTIVPQYPSLPTGAGPGDVVDIVIPVHAAISIRAEEARLALKELGSSPQNKGLDRNRSLSSIIRHQEFFILQPLFRALAIVIRGDSFNAQVLDIGQLSVLVIRTGMEEGLSAPISFDPIAHQITAFLHGSHGETAVETALDTAVDFVMDLEERELAAFGLRPDPVASTRGLEDGCFRGPSFRHKAIRLGWARWGDDPLVGPSSQWVDLDKVEKERMPAAGELKVAPAPGQIWSEREIQLWNARAKERMPAAGELKAAPPPGEVSGVLSPV